MNDTQKVRGRRTTTRVVPLALLTAACLAPEVRAQSQVIFGIDYRGGTISQPDTSTGTPIHESDLLKSPFGQPSFGPLPAPGTQFNGSQLGLAAYSICVGQTPG